MNERDEVSIFDEFVTARENFVEKVMEYYGNNPPKEVIDQIAKYEGALRNISTKIENVRSFFSSHYLSSNKVVKKESKSIHSLVGLNKSADIIPAFTKKLTVDEAYLYDKNGEIRKDIHRPSKLEKYEFITSNSAASPGYVAAFIGFLILFGGPLALSGATPTGVAWASTGIATVGVMTAYNFFVYRYLEKHYKTKAAELFKKANNHRERMMELKDKRIKRWWYSFTRSFTPSYHVYLAHKKAEKEAKTYFGNYSGHNLTVDEYAIEKYINSVFELDPNFNFLVSKTNAEGKKVYELSSTFSFLDEEQRSELLKTIFTIYKTKNNIYNIENEITEIVKNAAKSKKYGQNEAKVEIDIGLLEESEAALVQEEAKRAEKKVKKAKVQKGEVKINTSKNK